jgi:hypothetical protein
MAADSGVDIDLYAEVDEIDHDLSGQVSFVPFIRCKTSFIND